MGLFSGIKKASKSFSGAVKKAGKQFTQNARNSGSTFQAIGTFGAAPISIMAGSTLAGLQAVRPVLSEATGIIQENPMLAGLSGDALGIPGLGGLFGGGAPEMAETPTGSFTGPTAPSNATPLWVWLAVGGAALLGLILFLRRKPA